MVLKNHEFHTKLLVETFTKAFIEIITKQDFDPHLAVMASGTWMNQHDYLRPYVSLVAGIPHVLLNVRPEAVDKYTYGDHGISFYVTIAGGARFIHVPYDHLVGVTSIGYPFIHRVDCSAIIQYGVGRDTDQGFVQFGHIHRAPNETPTPPAEQPPGTKGSHLRSVK